MLNAKGRVFLRLSIMMFIQFILVLLKLTGAVSWNWVIVLIPLWIVIFFELLLIIIFLWTFRK